MTIFVYAPLESDKHIYDSRKTLSLRTRAEIFNFLEFREFSESFVKDLVYRTVFHSIYDPRYCLSLRTRAEIFNFLESIELFFALYRILSIVCL